MSDLADAIAALQQTLAKADGRAGRDADGDGKFNEHAKAAAIGIAVGVSGTTLAAKLGSAVALKATAKRRGKVAQRKWWDGSHRNDNKEVEAARNHPEHRVGYRIESYDLDALRPGWRDRSFAAGIASREKYTRLAERAAARGGARIGGLAAPAIGALAAGAASYAMSKTDGLDSAIAELEQTLAKAWDDRALRTATSRVADPTPAQATAGNYRKGHLKVHGLDVTIENQAGSERRGVGPDGKPWTSRLPAHYGYVRRTVGADGDAVDVYIGPAKSASHVYVVDQIDPATGRFDEHKCVLGCHTEMEARQLYHAGFSDGSGAQRIGAVAAMSVQQFKSWLRFGDTTAPVAFREGRKTDGLQKAMADLEATLAKADGRVGRDADGDGVKGEGEKGDGDARFAAQVVGAAVVGSLAANVGAHVGEKALTRFGDRVGKKMEAITRLAGREAASGQASMFSGAAAGATRFQGRLLRGVTRSSVAGLGAVGGLALAGVVGDAYGDRAGAKAHDAITGRDGGNDYRAGTIMGAVGGAVLGGGAELSAALGRRYRFNPIKRLGRGLALGVAGTIAGEMSGNYLDRKFGISRMLMGTGDYRRTMFGVDDVSKLDSAIAALEETLAKADIKPARRTVIVERALAKSAKGTDGDHDGVLSEGRNGNRQRGSAPAAPKTGILEREGGSLGDAVGFAAGGTLTAAALGEYRKKGGLKAAPAAGVGRKLSPGGIQTRFKALARGGVRGAVAGVARGVGGTAAKLVAGGLGGLAVGAGAMAVGAAADHALGNAKTRPRREGDYETIGNMAGTLVGGIAGGAAAGLAAIPSGPGAIAAAIAGEAGGAYGGGKVGGALGRLLDRMK